ncbi:MAG: phospholipase D-like domain-containing protein [Candidatus Cloacimonetes bacterium]|nr:phospholipase D-like domain-containing protein [Candidatus Cloacimonadota bacterium]
MSNFITNQGAAQLKTRLSTLIKESLDLKFLVGFFYFSGISELIESLKANSDLSLKILVGLNVDAQNYGLVEYAENAGKKRIERIEDYHESVLRALNNDLFDNELFYEQAGYILDQIISDRIIIRKTSRPNHAKLYLFKLKEAQVVRSNLFITGSSNLSKAGLTDREEFNVEISDYGFEKAEKYFDELWNTAIPITETDIEKNRLIENIRDKTLLKSIHPFDAYMFVVKTWLDSFYKHESSRYISLLLEKKGYKPFKYQIDAVTQALSIIEDNGGVILADVVGLGKSIIASLIARKLEKRGIIICPPGLIGDDAANSGWKKYKEDFELYDWEVRSGGDLDGIIEFIGNTDGIEVIIVDEAHRFRNSSTETYEKLKTICRGRNVILLTATPFNNSPADILSMLSLFIVPKKSNITLSNNLVDLFRSYNSLFKDLAYIRKNWQSKDPAKKEAARKKFQALFGEKEINIAKVIARAALLSKQIREVIEPVTIRRNRLDLINDPDYQSEVKKLSKIDDPKEWYYRLTPEQSAFYDRVIELYFTDNPENPDRFKGPIYKPYRYEGVETGHDKLSRQEQIDRLSQDNLYDIMRRQMVKRFESSFGAFRQSIVNIRDSYEKIKEFIKSSNSRYVLNRKLINKADGDDPDQIDELLSQFAEENKDLDSKKNRIYEVDKFVLKEQFYDDIESDICLFNKIITEIDSLALVENDPKRLALIQNVEAVLQATPIKGEPAPKLVIFSEYADTVKYLEPALQEHFTNRILVITGSIGKQNLDEINTNFDAAYPKNKQKNDYDVLLATDKLSEGFNLNRAAMVINYDIPWNPVRVIQRVGRINRISKKVFATLYITNFFPTEQGAGIVKSREIASHKMFMIHETLGEDARIFDAEEEPSPAKLFAKVQTNPYDLEQESLYTRLKKLMRKWEEEYPQRVKALDEMPIRIKTAKAHGADSLVMFIRKGKLFSVSQDFIDENKQLIPLPIEEAITRIECTPDTFKLPLSSGFWDTYTVLKEEAEKFSFKQSQQSNSVKAFNFLSFLLEQDARELVSWRSFLIMLREDIDAYGTLPEYTLKSICDWENGGKPDYHLIAAELEKLSNTLGKNYLKKVKDSLKAYEQQVIVAIENQAKDV